MLHRLMTSIAVASGIVALAFATTAPSHAETFKVSHWVPPQHPFAKSLADWGKSIGEDSGGEIKISVFPAGQLGPASDHYDHGQERYRRRDLGKSGIQSGALADHFLGRAAPDHLRPDGGVGGADQVVPEVRRQGDAGHPLLLHAYAGIEHPLLDQQADPRSPPTSRVNGCGPRARCKRA